MKTNELRIRLDERVRAAEIIHRHVMDTQSIDYLDLLEKIQRDVMSLSDLSPETTPAYEAPQNIDQTVVKFNPVYDYQNRKNIEAITAEFVANLNGWYDPESGLAQEQAVSWLTETIKIEKNEAYAQGWNEGQQALKIPPERPINHERE